mmetsp:Transcript_45192/g.94801  ORF Transcript_45192/g.94801 Transcript_45192/m.94801 type:complete len:265 (-) Transcript_45192:758-1552(-)
MSLCARLGSDIWNSCHQSSPQCQQIMNRICTILPIPNRLRSETGRQLQPLQIPLRFDQLAQLIIGLEPSQQSAKLMIIILMLQPRLIFEELPYPRHDSPQKRLALLIGGKERSPHGTNEYHRLHRLVAPRGIGVGVKIQQQLGRAGILQHRSPIGGRLDGPHVLRGLVGIGPDEIEIETSDRETERLFPQYDLLAMVGRADGAGLQLFQGGETQLKHLEQTQIPKGYGGLAMLREGAPARGYVELVHQLVQNLESQNAMIDRGL